MPLLDGKSWRPKNWEAGARAGAYPAYGTAIHNHHHSRDGGHKQGLDHSLLPDPYDFYDEELPRLKGYGEWRQAQCPFHHDRNPSLSVNIVTGGFFCHGCGAKGGSVIDFYLQLHGLGFVDAVKALGAWA